MLAILYDIHGNLSALDAVIVDARERGADRWFVGGDVALFGPAPCETVVRLFELQPAVWIRGNGERWTAQPGHAPEQVLGAVQAAREMLGEGLVNSLAALPESMPIDDRTRAWHASPVSDVRSFAPEPADDEAELLKNVVELRLVFGHTHIPFRRKSAGQGAIELLNPGSVGMPFDGDHRASYALRHDDGTIEHHRVGYDHVRVPVALRAAYGDAPWLDVIEQRFANARLESS
ncbi:MAG: metallophosphoesterase family protein [Solirubrobacterales bacterium]|nr:metallophosphoesterase family protein [Solirubrobacterales bacterium]